MVPNTNPPTSVPQTNKQVRAPAELAMVGTPNGTGDFELESWLETAPDQSMVAEMRESLSLDLNLNDQRAPHPNPNQFQIPYIITKTQISQISPIPASTTKKATATMTVTLLINNTQTDAC
jgi:hypothetical protein